MALLEICGTADKAEPRLMEPEISPALFVNGTEIVAEDGVVHLTSWARILSYDGDYERRICSRLTMSNAQARRLVMELRRALAQGGH